MASGLVLFTYVVVHLVNHSLGIVSVAAMEAMLRWVYPVWSSIPGQVVLYGAFLMHLALAFYALWERRTLRLRRLEALSTAGFQHPVACRDACHRHADKRCLPRRRRQPLPEGADGSLVR